MTKKELQEIAHAIVWNVFEGKKTYQFPKGFFNTITQEESEICAQFIRDESSKLQEWLNKRAEAEQKQREAEQRQWEAEQRQWEAEHEKLFAKQRQWESDRKAHYYFNFFPIGEA